MNRPTLQDPSIAIRLADKVAPLISIWSENTISASKAHKDFIQVWDAEDNAYALARRLADEFNYPHNIELVAVLDICDIQEAYAETVKEWVGKNNIQPTLAVGEQVIIQHPEKGQGQGEISEIHPQLAQYRVTTGDGSGLLVNYEDAALLN